MRKALLLSAILLLPSLMFAQSPPQIPLTGNIGVQGSVAILGGVTVPMPSDANYTLTPAQWSNKTLIITSTASLSAMRSIIAPLNKGQEYNIENNTTGGQSITITGASGTGVMIANGKAASVFFDGTNYIQAATLTVITAQTNELLAKATDGSLKSSGVFSDGVNSKSNIPFSAQADNGVINSDYFRSTPTSADAIPNTLNSSLCAAGCTFELTPTTTDLEQIPYQPTTSTPVSPILNSPANAGPAIPYLIIDRRLAQANHTSAMAWNAINAGVDRFGAQAPFNFTTVNTRRVTASDGYYPLRVYSQLVSGGKNYSNQFDGANGTVFEKPNSSAFGMTLRKWTAGQEGGANSLAVQNLGTGDTVLRVTEGVATGISDGDDEGLEADRENIIYNTRRFGMVVSTITPDALGNYVFRGTRAAGYSEDPAEHLPVLNITKDKNTSQAGNIVDAVAYPADPRFLQLTPDSGGGIPAALGNSAVSFSTAVVTGAAPGNINANEWGVGSLSNVVVPVVDASAFTVSTSIPVCFSSQGDNFEMAHVTAVNIPGKTVTLDYIRDQHASNEMLAQGGGCGYAISMYADDTTIASLGRYGNDYANLTNSSTMHNAYYVLATIGGKYIVYTNSGATSNQLEWHTKAYMNTSPKVAGQLTATISGGSLATLTMTNASSVNYVGNTSSNLGFGQQVLAYPTITFTGGGCAVEPSVTVKGYAGSPFQTPQVPILSVPGDPGWSAGSGCTSAPTATMQTVYSNPYHLYPSTVSFRIIDPVTGQWTLGNYLMTESIRPSDWAVSDTLEISGWWNQQGGGGSSTVGKIFTGQSGVFGAARAWDFTGNWAYRDTLLAVNNSTPSQNYWSINGPSAGTAYEQPPDIWTIGGWSRVAFALEQPPMRAITSVTCGASANSGADSNIPCLNGVAQTYNLFELQRLGSQSIDIVSYNNGTNQITFNTLGGTLFGGPFSVNSLAGGLVKSGTGGLFSNATAGTDYSSPSVANTYTKTQTFKNSQDAGTLGPELAISTGWTLGSGWSGTFATGFTATQGAGTLSFNVPTGVGTNYFLTYTLTNTNPVTNSAVCLVLGGSAASQLNCAGAPPAQSVGFKAINTSTGLVITPTAPFAGTISNISLKVASTVIPSPLNSVDASSTAAFELRTGSSASGNEFLGLQSGQFITSLAKNNFASGSLAMANEVVGGGDVAIGWKAMFADWGSINMTAVGAGTLAASLNTFGDTAVGSSVLPMCTTCSVMTAIGSSAGINVTTASSDVLIGSRVAPSLTTGSNDIIIGGFANNSNVDVPTPTTSNYMNLGNAFTAQGINNIQFGGAFGLGKQLASFSLDVNGSIRSTGLADFAASPTVTPGVTGSTTYTYFVVAYLADGTHTNPSPRQTITNGPASLDVNTFNTISWTAIPNAASYRVFLTAPVVSAIGTPTTLTTINDTGFYSGTAAPAGNNTSGLILSSNQDAASLGTELTNATGWTLHGTWSGSYASGFTSPTGNTGTLTFPVPTVIGARYILSLNQTNSNSSNGAATMCPTLGGSSANSTSGFCSLVAGSIWYSFVATDAVSGLVFTPSPLFNGTISSISLKQSTGTMPSILTESDSTLATALEVRVGLQSKLNQFVGLGSGQRMSSMVFGDTAFGANALASEFTGSSNTAFGSDALQNEMFGINNTAFGANALKANINSSGNIAVGVSTLSSLLTGTGNVAMGLSSGSALVSGAENVFIGSYVGTNLTSGTGNIFIGQFHSPGMNNETPSTSISNYMNIGNTLTCLGVNSANYSGACGIGKQTPLYSFDVNGTIRTTGLTDFSGPPTVAVNGATGTTTYTYTVVAFLKDGTHTNPSTPTTITNGNATLDGTNNFNHISWTPVAGAASYKVYMTSPGTGSVSYPNSFNSFADDVGVYTNGATAPAGNNTFGIIVGASQQLTGVQGVGPNIASFTGSATNDHLVSLNAAGTEVDSGISTSDISALSGSLASLCHSDGTNCFSTVGNISAVTITASGATAACASGFTCKSNRGEAAFSQPGASKGSMTVTFGTAYAGTPVCSVVENGATDNTAHFFNWFATSSSLIIAPSIQDPTSYDTTLVYTCQP